MPYMYHSRNGGSLNPSSGLVEDVARRPPSLRFGSNPHASPNSEATTLSAADGDQKPSGSEYAERGPAQSLQTRNAEGSVEHLPLPLEIEEPID